MHSYVKHILQLGNTNICVNTIIAVDHTKTNQKFEKMKLLLFIAAIFTLAACSKNIEKQCVKKEIHVTASISKDSIRIAVAPNVDAVKEVWVITTTLSSLVNEDVYIQTSWDVYASKSSGPPIRMYDKHWVSVHSAKQLSLTKDTEIETPLPSYTSAAVNFKIEAVVCNSSNYTFTFH